MVQMIRHGKDKTASVWRKTAMLLAVSACVLAGWGHALPEEMADEVGDSLDYHSSREKWGGTVRFTPGKQLIMDDYSRQWIHGRKVYTVAAELSHTAFPSDSDAFAADFGYPTFSFGVAYDFNHGVTMHRYPSPSWGQAQEVDYMSKLGNALSVYGSFSRPLLRTRHWEAAYVFRMGAGFNAHKYNRKNAIDNELIGSHATIYFGAACMVSYFFQPEWALTAGVEYHHHSNGALYRPNKGENTLGPTVGLVYAPAHRAILDAQRQQVFQGEREKMQGFWYVDLAAGVGAKTLLEDWQVTQFHTAPDDPDYRTESFTVYPAFSASASFMRRYARRWASGVGADVFYGTYYRHVREVEREGKLTQGTSTISPWSVGIAARHEVYYHRLSLAMSLGVYLYRHMGLHAKDIEKPYYERIGLRYAFPKWNNMYVGMNVNAHFTKADFTELTLGLPLRMK